MIPKDNKIFLEKLLEIERTGTIQFNNILLRFYKDIEKTFPIKILDELSKLLMKNIVDSETIASKNVKLTIKKIMPKIWEINDEIFDIMRFNKWKNI